QRILVAVLSFSLIALPGYSYTFTFEGAIPISHRGSATLFFDQGIDPDGPDTEAVTVTFDIDDAASEELKTAIENAATTWNNVRSVDGFTGLTIVTRRTANANTVQDESNLGTQVGVNIISFAATLPTGITFDSSEFGKVFFTSTQHQNSTFSFTDAFNTTQRQIVDVDIAFNPSPPSTIATEPRGGQVDAESLALHFLGRACGLNVSTLMSAVMYPFPNVGNTHKRALTQDDKSGMAIIYPSANFRTFFGQLTMRLGKRTRIVPLEIDLYVGAHVVAINNETGIIPAAYVTTDQTLASDQDFMNEDLNGLPPGEYKFLIEPNDGPITGDDVPFQPNNSFDTTAPGRFLDDTTSTNTGSVTLAQNFNSAATDLVFNITAGGGDSVTNSVGLFSNAADIAVNTVDGQARPVYVAVGKSITLTLGGVGLVEDTNNPNQLVITGPDITHSIVAVSPAGTQATLKVDVAADPDDDITTEAEPRAIIWQQTGQLTSLVGGLVVIPDTGGSTGGGGSSGGDVQKTQGKNQSNCCVATVMLSNSASELFTLRSARDDLLRQSSPGMAATSVYYSNSPVVAPSFARSATLQAIGRKLLRKSAVGPLQIVRPQRSGTAPSYARRRPTSHLICSTIFR
ncbi:MAG: hypothetical protein QF473_11575, partial [Planctomycetota bacterium]|nr:hypothetical protein [Planctomycetota bacterium]